MSISPEDLAKIIADAIAPHLATADRGRQPAPGASDPRSRAASSDGPPKPIELRNSTFIDDSKVSAPAFSDLGGAAGVDDPERMLKGWTGEIDGEIEVEAAIGDYVTSPSALLQILSDCRRSVAIISAAGANYDGVVGSWTGTGFLVGKNLLLTNHHVLNTPQVARAAIVEFNYEVSPENLRTDDLRPPQATQRFALDPARLFITSDLKGESTASGQKGGLDYTFVWIEDAAAAIWGSIPMERSSFTVKPGDQAFVIHHPDGEPKQVSLDDTDILAIKATVIHYSSDTMGGSSGAPVFDRRGRLIALHHASRRLPKRAAGGKVAEIVNEGVKIAAIAMDLENRVRAGGPDASHAQTVLDVIVGSDTMAGFFGGNGREIAPGRTGPEAVVDAYRGTDQDIDVGFWNIEWLATRWNEPSKLNGAARVIADLNLDAWGLSEVSPPAVKALVDRIKALYGETYDYELSEPNAAPGRQSTAMIWRASSLQGERKNWPGALDKLLRQRSDDPDLVTEAVHGKIFDRYPGLFEFRTRGGLPDYRFFAVPLHLKAMDEGSLRRRLASRLLARAVEEVTAVDPVDVILGGDVNAPLASGDFTAIGEAGFSVLGAQDEREGAFSYIKSPKSLIDNIFLSPSMKQTVGRADYFIIARDRTMKDYRDVSDHRPVAVRLSLKASAAPPPSAAPADLDAMIDGWIAAAERKHAPAAEDRPRGKKT